MPIKKWIIPAMAGLLLAACSKDSSNNSGGTPPANCDAVSTTFAANVLPLMQTRCSTGSGCHGTGATNSGGPLTNHAQISARASNIRSQVNSGAMPKGSSLTAAEKSIIICWIDKGALNN
jgi:uncharacterized membrane protein